MTGFYGINYKPVHRNEHWSQSKAAQMAKHVPGINNPAGVLKAQTKAQAVAAKNTAIANRTVPLEFRNFSKAAVQMRYPGLFPGESAATAWAKPGTGGIYAAGDKFYVMVVKGKDGSDVPVGILPQHLLEGEQLQSKGYNPVHEHAAFDKPVLHGLSPALRTLYYVGQRYQLYFHGAKKTLCDPQSMGMIFANLTVTSIFLSAMLYGMLYMVQYGAIEHNLHNKHQKDDKQQNQTAPPAMAQYALMA